jgi:hypothetical protein
MNHEIAARRLIYAIRRLGCRIYLELHPDGIKVAIDRENTFSKAPRSARVPQAMVDKARTMKAALIAILSLPSDPETYAASHMHSELRLMQVRAVKLAGRR